LVPTFYLEYELVHEKILGIAFKYIYHKQSVKTYKIIERQNAASLLS